MTILNIHGQVVGPEGGGQNSPWRDDKFAI